MDHQMQNMEIVIREYLVKKQYKKKTILNLQLFTFHPDEKIIF